VIEYNQNRFLFGVLNSEMAVVVGIRFKSGPKIYYFDPAGLPVKRGDLVVAETVKGPELGYVVWSPRDVPEEELAAPLKPVLRIANEEDRRMVEENRAREQYARGVCQEKIAAHGLPMKLVDVSYAFDGSRVTFYFTADGRVDFRELVKDVAAALHTKILFHQIGVRDAARFYNGLGPCGLQLCCARFLTSFEPVSMKMAKEQSLFLNPSKFSGVCSKLMCCLRFEHEFYARSTASGGQTTELEAEAGESDELSSYEDEEIGENDEISWPP
jgi:cell fate regulator YaaT (PSP1 superfamily)